jgi:hypothetical protein
MAGRISHTSPLLRMAAEFKDGPGQRLGVCRCYHPAVDAILNGLQGTAHPCGHDRQTCAHGLQQGQGKAFPQGGVHEEVQGAINFGQIAASAQEPDRVIQVQGVDLTLQVFLSPAFSYQQNKQVWNLAPHLRQRRQEVNVPFLVFQAANRSDDQASYIQPLPGCLTT